MMLLKIKINDNDKFEIYSIDDASIDSEHGQSFITLTFSSYREIVEEIQLWKECYIIDELKDIIYTIIPFYDAPSLNIIERTGTDFYMAIDSTPQVYNYEIRAATYQIKKKEDEEKKEMKYYFYVRFENSNGSFSDSTKIYPYEVSQEHYNRYRTGDLLKIHRLEDGIPKYSNTSVRIEGKQTMTDSFLMEQLNHSQIRYIKESDLVKHSVEPPDWFDNFIKEHKFTLELKYNPATDKFTCYYRDPNIGFLTYNEIIEKYYKPSLGHLTCEQLYANKSADFIINSTADITDEQLKNMLANAIVQTPELAYQFGANPPDCTLYIDNTNAQNICCTSAPNINTIYENITKNNEKKTEEKEMKMFDNITKNMKFGKYETADAKYSINGIAFRDEKGGYFVYVDNVATDVTGMTIDMPLFCMPVALSQINTNDIILFKDKMVIVKEKTDDGIKVIYPLTSEIKVIIPEKNLFNFDYVTKIINPFEQFVTTASKDNPFGNFLPLMMFGDKVDDDSLMKLMMFNQMGQGDFMSNPWMMYMLMKDGKSNDFFLTMMLAKGATLGVDLAQTKTE